MKKNLFLAALAIVALASCTDSDFVGNNSPDPPVANESAAISFGSKSKAITRADHVGADAAGLLNKKFYVVSFKGDGASDATMSQTFDNYLVQWTSNTAGQTQSNTSDWEYVGLTTPAWSGIQGNTQTIKFWDYSVSQYDFIAWSPGTATPVTGDATGDTQVKVAAVAKGDYAPSYTLTGTRNALANCYIADMVTAYKADMSPIQPKFQEEVQFTFRNLACKVRMALYETVPGYSVKDVKFYVDDTTPISTGTNVTDAQLFMSGSTDADYFYTKGTYTVNFPTKGSANISKTDYNKAHVNFVATGKDTKESFGALVLVGPEPNGHEATGSNYLGRSLPDASYANPGNAGSPYYKIMLPNETGSVLELRVDYTLLATDGSGEEIKVHGAKAFVPQIYATWKPNYAYTYIFKISDNTNGWTSTVTADPAGLYPITFDAIVVDSEEHTQSTITTVAYPSITTYQKGHDVSKDEYLASTGDIYVQVMKNGTLANNLTADGVSSLYTLSGKTSYTEADVMDALNIPVSSTGNPLVITGRNDVVLTTAEITNNIAAIPGPDGNDITVTAGTAAKFTPTASTTYAYVYDTKTYGGQYYSLQPAGWPDGFYEETSCATPSSSWTPGIYYRKESIITTYVELAGAAPTDWNSSDNVYYSDEACTTKITAGYTSLHKFVLSAEPGDWNATNNVYYTDTDCTIPANSAYADGTYFKKVKCYRKYTVSNKIYGVKVIKVV